jgi:hypothetical protein
MDWRRIVGVFGIALCAWPGMSVAQVPDLVAYRARMDATARQILENIRPNLDAPSAKILDTIVIETRDTWDTNALAKRGLGQRRVVVLNSGLLVYTEWLSLAMLAEGSGHEGCMNEYSKFLAGHAREERHKSGFLEFARKSAGHCEGAQLDVVDERSTEFRERIFESVVATVLLHEVGHHVLGHVPMRENNLYHARLREMAADQWAIKVAVDSDYDLRPAVPLFLVLDTIDGATFVEEIRSSHPSGLQRIRDLLVQTRMLLEKKDSVDAHSMDASILELDRALQ